MSRMTDLDFEEVAKRAHQHGRIMVLEDEARRARQSEARLLEALKRLEGCVVWSDTTRTYSLWAGQRAYEALSSARAAIAEAER